MDSLDNANDGDGGMPVTETGPLLAKDLVPPWVEEPEAEQYLAEEYQRSEHERKRLRRQKREEAKTPSFASRRVSELTRLYNARYKGGILPDDDDGRVSFYVMACHLAMLPDSRRQIRKWAERRAPWLANSELQKLIDDEFALPRRWRADTLGRKLSLTTDERARLNIRTIRSN
jgi:hypothetical protein